METLTARPETRIAVAQSSRLADVAIGRINNLNAIRLLLALFVIVTHSFDLTGNESAEPLSILTRGQMNFGHLAVDLFFFISGFLITASWMNSKTMDDYFRRRVLRIFPAYVLALIFSFIVALLFSAHPLGALRYAGLIIKDIFSLSFSSTGGSWVFANNPYPHSGNGSLWTIAKEFYCYVMVAAIGLFGLFRFRKFILALSFLMFCYYMAGVVTGKSTGQEDRRFLTFFMAGMCMSIWRDRIDCRWWIALLCLIAIAIGMRVPRSLLLITPLAGGYVVLVSGYSKPMLRWTNTTDLSYGTYLFAFPIQQAIVALGIRSPWLLVAIAAPLVLGTAFLSWTFIEKPCLALKSRFSDFRPSRGLAGSAVAQP